MAFRALWSNDTMGSLRRALAAVLAGELPVGERQANAVPMTRGMGAMSEVLEVSGNKAQNDVMVQAPPMYAMARTASLFRPLPPLGRGIAVMAGSVLVMAAVIGGVILLL